MYVMQRSVNGALDEHGTITRFYLQGEQYSADDFLPSTLAGFVERGEALAVEGKSMGPAPENKMIEASPENKAAPGSSPRTKGVCRKCGKYIGRGVGLHARRCGGARASLNLG